MEEECELILNEDKENEEIVLLNDRRETTPEILDEDGEQYEIEGEETDEFIFRPLKPGDQKQAKILHDNCLPVKYDNSFFNVAVNGKLNTMACTIDNEQIVGIIVARIIDQWTAKVMNT
eukprot:TRINITY_DN2888_c0_g1_i1.p1 TRINITY_DN2888_c0_g1~~TRINITY_DN2888_c0_g1_i1.p1  ORF type:complete len:119 (-),score=41.64 TRINITY_DN2888_c0_g1_i1:82-438(-)